MGRINRGVGRLEEGLGGVVGGTYARSIVVSSAII